MAFEIPPTPAKTSRNCLRVRLGRRLVSPGSSAETSNGTIHGAGGAGARSSANREGSSAGLSSERKWRFSQAFWPSTFHPTTLRSLLLSSRDEDHPLLQAPRVTKESTTLTILSGSVDVRAASRTSSQTSSISWRFTWCERLCFRLRCTRHLILLYSSPPEGSGSPRVCPWGNGLMSSLT
jgi:hypothetical protein